MEFHPAAELFPMMSKKEQEELVSDIQANGLLVPIVLFDGKVLDGRNRFEACIKAGIDPRYETAPVDIDPYEYVWSLNAERRHLPEGQKATIYFLKKSKSEEWHREQKRKREEANRARSEAAQERPRTQEGTFKPASGLSCDKTLDNAKPHTHEVVAEEIHTSTATAARAQALVNKRPDLAEKVAQGDLSLGKATRAAKKEDGEKALIEAQAKISETARTALSEVCDIRHCSMQELLANDIKPDCIITDPPYEKEYLPIYNALAEFSHDIPLVAVMCGQSYLPEILSMMCRHLRYRWTLAYLTPGGQAVQQWQSKVNAFWKPILLFGESLEWIGDVCRSSPNDNDKRFHDWGQSESGMVDVVKRLTKPGQLVCDPFCGAGTTAVVSLGLGRRFVGCDIDDAMVQKSIRRCELLYGENR